MGVFCPLFSVVVLNRCRNIIKKAILSNLFLTLQDIGLEASLWVLLGKKPGKEKSMQFEVFCDRVKEALEEHFYQKGVEVNLGFHDIMKNNGVKLKGITIMEAGRNIAPNIYLNSYYPLYQEGMALEEIIDKILMTNEKNQVEEFDLDCVLQFDRVRDHIVYKLIHYEQNEELLKEVPHMKYLDMAVVFYVMLSKGELGNVSMLIRKEHLSMWNVSKEDVFEASAKNTPQLLEPKIVNIEAAVKNLCLRRREEDPGNEEYFDDILGDMEAMEDSFPLAMYVLSNSTNFYGAACVLYRGVLKEFAGSIHSNLYVLPSSVHEVILIPSNFECDPDALADMVREINETAVEREEVLSNHVYFYDMETDELQMCA